MKPLFVLLIASTVALFILKIIQGSFTLPLSARIGMTAMLIFTAIGHFAFPKGMALMIPEIIPFKKELVYFTAILEIAAGIGLLFPAYRVITAWLLILFFILILPANIKAATDHLDFQKGTYDGPGLNYLWFRVPLQFFFIAWVYLSVIWTD